MVRACLEHLRHEHREIETALDEFEASLEARKATTGQATQDGAAFRGIIARFTNLVMLHIRKEDQILFPALEGFLPSEEGPLAVLRGEHAKLRVEVGRLQAAGRQLFSAGVRLEEAETFERAGRAAVQLLRDNIYKQDRVLFPLVARFLSPELDQQLLRHMQAVRGGEGGAPLSDPQG